jgi:RNA polymerase sigma-70 factor (ECF subfamily)
MHKETLENLEDIQLAKACQEGNQRAQAQLYETYGKQMMSVCIRYARDNDEAQDLFQDGFIKVFRKIGLYDGKGPIGAWIRRTMANNALDHLRKVQRELKQNSFFKEEYLYENEDLINPFEDQDTELPNQAQLMEMISRMPQGYRTVFSMYAVEEYSHKEIADALGITESTSKTQYRKAKAFMKKLIENELNQAERE